jgi:hypothetical protein
MRWPSFCDARTAGRHGLKNGGYRKAGLEADRPADRILEARSRPPWPGGHEIDAEPPHEPM